MIRRTILAAFFLTAVQAPAASASEGLAPLREAVSGLPSVLAQNPERIQGVVVDLSALAALAGRPDLPREALRRLAFGAEVPALAMLGNNGVEAWTEAAGVAPGHIRTITGLGPVVAIWRFDSSARQASVVEHLGRRGFRRAGAEMLAAPGPIPIQQRTTDPWLSLRAPSVTVAITETTLVQAPAENAARLFTRVVPEESFAADPAVAALLSGAEAQLGEARVIQALFFSPVLALRAGDPGAMLGASPREAMERMRQAQAARTPGLPPFARGLMLDVARLGRAGLLIVLAYPDCDAAQAAGDRLQAKWSDPPARVSVRAVPAAGNICAASILVEAEAAGLANPVLDALWGAIMRRAPTPLDIG